MAGWGGERAGSPRHGDLLAVPEPGVGGVTPHLPSPTSLSVPSPWGTGLCVSRRASSTASSIFDLSQECEQLERALRENDTITVKKMLHLHHTKFPVTFSGASVHDRSSCDSRSRRLSHNSMMERSSGSSRSRRQSHNSSEVELLLRKSQTLLDYVRDRERRFSVSDSEAPPLFRTALHVAVQHGALDVLRLLLRYGVDPNDSGLASLPGGWSRRASSATESGHGLLAFNPSLATPPRSPSPSASPLSPSITSPSFPQHTTLSVPGGAAAAAATCIGGGQESAMSVTANRGGSVSAAPSGGRDDGTARSSYLTLQPPPLSLPSLRPSPGSASLASASTATAAAVTSAGATATSSIGGAPMSRSPCDIVVQHAPPPSRSCLPLPEILESGLEDGGDPGWDCYTPEELLGLPPVYLAVAEGRTIALRLLLRYGAWTDVEDRHGRTPLHLATSPAFFNKECALLLLRYGARAQAADCQGTRPATLWPDILAEQQKLVHEALAGRLSPPAAHPHPWHSRRRHRGWGRRARRDKHSFWKCLQVPEEASELRHPERDAERTGPCAYCGSRRAV